MTKNGIIAAVIIMLSGGGPSATVGHACTANVECPGGYCAKEPGNCTGSGNCSPLNPELMCASVYDPVCGCDGKTYGNACEAGRVGVNIQSQGACVITGTCGSNADCSTGYCATVLEAAAASAPADRNRQYVPIFWVPCAAAMA